VSNFLIKHVAGLHDPITNQLLGFLGTDGVEYVLPALDPGRTFTDASGTPGSTTINSDRGRAAFASGTNSVTITSSYVNANSVVLVHMQNADATLTLPLTVAPSAGGFTVTGNANATGTPAFNFVVFN